MYYKQQLMSRKGPEVGVGMLDFVEDIQLIQYEILEKLVTLVAARRPPIQISTKCFHF